MPKSPTDSMEKAMLAAMREELPEAMVRAVQDALSERDSFRQELEGRDTELADAERMLAALRTERYELNERLVRVQDLEVREAAVAFREGELEHLADIINIREEHAEQQVGLMFGLVGQVFGNPQLRYTRQRDVPVEMAPAVYTNPDGSMSYAASGGQVMQPSSETVTVTEGVNLGGGLFEGDDT